MCLSPADMSVAELTRHIKAEKKFNKENYMNGLVPSWRQRRLDMFKKERKLRRQQEKDGIKLTVQPRHVNSVYDQSEGYERAFNR